MQIPEGYALVPLEPNEAMVKAGNSVEPRVELIYEAMVREAMKTAPVAMTDEDPFPTVQGEESA